MSSFTETHVGYHKRTGDRVMRVNQPSTGLSYYITEKGRQSTTNGQLRADDIVDTVLHKDMLHAFMGYKKFYDQAVEALTSDFEHSSDGLFAADWIALEDALAYGGSTVPQYSEKSWPITSNLGGDALVYSGGFYEYGGSVSNFGTPVPFGEVNSPYGAHVMFVVGGTFSTDTTYHVSGTKVNDSAELELAYDATIVIPSGSEANYYAETPEKFVGQVTITKATGDTVSSCYGFCKYWDNNNADFTVVGIDSLWLAGAADSDFDIELIHHKSSGWTYAGSGTPVHPTALAQMSVDYGDAHVAVDGEQGAWKRDNLSTAVSGGSSEGTIILVTTSSGRTIVEGSGNFMLRVQV